MIRSMLIRLSRGKNSVASFADHTGQSLHPVFRFSVKGMFYAWTGSIRRLP
jgi:hypothetical protein